MDFFFSAFAARFSSSVFAGFFFSLFFWSIPLLMAAVSLSRRHPDECRADGHHALRVIPMEWSGFRLLVIGMPCRASSAWSLAAISISQAQREHLSML
ncbi:MAG TPA: hypothetical protein VF267_14445 [Gammaproteobacteria bacterium]